MKKNTKLLTLNRLTIILLMSFFILNLNLICLAESNYETESNWTMFHQNSQHTGYQSSSGSGNISNYGIIWVKNFDYTIYGEPTVANIDRTGEKEIIFGNDEGFIYCLNPSGKIIWKYKCDKGSSSFYGNRISSSPLLFNLTGNSSYEIIFTSDNGKIYCLSAWGEKIWDFQSEHMIVSSPAIGDITYNGNLDIAILSKDGLYTLNNNGKLIWKYPIKNGGISSPAIIDINNDGIKDIIFGAANGKLYAITTNISNNYSPELLWTYQIKKVYDPMITSSPVIEDLNFDGKYEILIGATDNSLYCFNNKGEKIWNVITDGPIYNTPSIADINNDGEYEIIIGTAGKQLLALKSNGDYLWHIEYQKKIVPDSTIFDVDGDGFLEITSIDESHYIYAPGRTDRVIYSINIINYTGKTIHKLKYIRKCYDEFYGVTIADLQSDGKLEILTGTHDGDLYCYGELENQNDDNLFDGKRYDDQNKYRIIFSFGALIIILIVILVLIAKLRKRRKRKQLEK